MLSIGALAASGPLTVYTVNYPLEYFASRIGGEHVKARYPGPADEDPAFWKPDAQTIGSYQQADLILLNGAGYAKWLSRASLPRARSFAYLSLSDPLPFLAAVTWRFRKLLFSAFTETSR